ncbi:MAG TPA: Holliday junction branch migration protein RuvA [Candidatus Limnocylindrales bacterium]|nr:Holliday junction branch migration protein RuvA [Candidatus Limnocylindrales bacterium]
MIASVDGVVGAVGPDGLVVEVGGLGYRVFAGPGVLARARTGERLKLYTHHLVRQDAQALYGFRTPEELGFFELLLTVTGVGPKVALAIVAARPVADLQLAILQGDEAVLIGVSGVGKRLAARICLELKEKVAAAGMAASVAGGGGVGSGTPAGAESEVVAALQALGYAAGEARDAARAAIASLPPAASLEDRVKAALHGLRRD